MSLCDPPSSSGWQIGKQTGRSPASAFGPEQIISTGRRVVDFLSVTDVDQDGDKDIVTQPDAWFENVDGHGDAYTRNESLPESFSQNLRSPAASPAFADIDGDGNIDRIDFESNRAMEHTDIVLMLDGGPTEQLLGESNEEGIKELHVVDLNTDGKLDVVARFLTIKTDRENISWIENWGEAGFSKQQRILTSPERGTFEIKLADLDRDEDIDIIVHSLPDHSIVWYENTTHAAPDTPVGLPGDANGDELFDQLDIVQVLQAGKYSTGEAATTAEGDWNGDGIFDRLDIVTALAFGAYLI